MKDTHGKHPKNLNTMVQRNSPIPEMIEVVFKISPRFPWDTVYKLSLQRLVRLTSEIGYNGEVSNSSNLFHKEF